MENGVIVQRIWAAASYGDEEEITHTAENGYECDKPDCICHEAEESDTALPVPWNALCARS